MQVERVDLIGAKNEGSAGSLVSPPARPLTAFDHQRAVAGEGGVQCRLSSRQAIFSLVA